MDGPAGERGDDADALDLEEIQGKERCRKHGPDFWRVGCLRFAPCGRHVVATLEFARSTGRPATIAVGGAAAVWGRPQRNKQTSTTGMDTFSDGLANCRHQTGILANTSPAHTHNCLHDYTTTAPTNDSDTSIASGGCFSALDWNRWTVHTSWIYWVVIWHLVDGFWVAYVVLDWVHIPPVT